MDELIEVLTTEAWAVVDPEQVALDTVLISSMEKGHLEIRMTGGELRDALRRAAIHRAFAESSPP
jgi:hypothetical protein